MQILGSRTTVKVDRMWVLLLVAAVGVGGMVSQLGPERLTLLLAAAAGLLLVGLRPVWGVGTILALLLVQYGAPKQLRTGGGWTATLIPSGEGQLTINNLLGLVLALLLVYRVYREHDWSFLRSRQVQILGLVTLSLILSALISQVDPAELVIYNLRTREQDPIRLLVSRFFFAMLVVAFLRTPRDLRVIVGIYLALTLASAWEGASSALFGAAEKVRTLPEYRAGGYGALIQTAINPNRLALVATLALVYIWEYAQAHARRWWGWLTQLAVLLLVLTVFLTASRGGVIGLLATATMLFLRRRGASTRVFSRLVVAVVAVVLVMQVVPAVNWERLQDLPGITADPGTTGSSIQRRQYTLAVGLRLIRDNPVFGVGYGNWEIQRFKTDPLRSVASPHNSYILALAEGGLATLFLYLLLFALTIRRLGELERSPEIMTCAREDGTDWLLSATRICLLSFLVFSLFADLWELVFLYMLIGIAGVLIRMYGDGSPEQQAGAALKKA